MSLYSIGSAVANSDQIGSSRSRQGRRIDAAEIELKLAGDESLRTLNARRDDDFRRETVFSEEAHVVGRPKRNATAGNRRIADANSIELLAFGGKRMRRAAKDKKCDE